VSASKRRDGKAAIMSAMVTSPWDPAQYNRFTAEREQPFWDLASLLEPSHSPVVVDLGCGDGRLSAALHRQLGASRTIGIDSSPSMLSKATTYADDGVCFESGDIGKWRSTDVDIVFSNAALQWVPDHRRVLRQWRDALSSGGQLAVQMPANADHASHRISSELAVEWFGDGAPPDPVAENVLRPEQYSEVLHTLGFLRQHVRLQVYGHELSSTAEVVEWVKGTSLTRFRAILGDDRFEQFVNEYGRRLLAELGDKSPYFYAFKRILLWGVLPRASEST
jgi:trans-aconitate 2-methyltransferase